jgi:hypothetical protein
MPVFFTCLLPNTALCWHLSEALLKILGARLPVKRRQAVALAPQDYGSATAAAQSRSSVPGFQVSIKF